MGEISRRHGDRRGLHTGKGGAGPANGAAHTIVGHANLVAEVKRITGGAMVPVVYDSVGKDTFMASLDCLAPLGLMVSYGSASGPVPPVDLGMLTPRAACSSPGRAWPPIRRPRDLLQSAADLFEVVEAGAVKIRSTRPSRWPMPPPRISRWRPALPPAAPS
jgi:NADPH:quinone reductase-like Zn-dependent oxidoreductase